MLDTVVIERAALASIQHKVALRTPVTIMSLVPPVTKLLARTCPKEEVIVVDKGVGSRTLEVTPLAPEVGDRPPGILQSNGGRVLGLGQGQLRRAQVR